MTEMHLRPAHVVGVDPRVGFPLGGGRVVQMYFDRRYRYFEPGDVALASMLEPALGRILTRPTYGRRLDHLSDAERRVLRLVAQGGSNQDVAQQVSVAESTVRKHLEHLEHAYRAARGCVCRSGEHCGSVAAAAHASRISG